MKRRIFLKTALAAGALTYSGGLGARRTRLALRGAAEPAQVFRGFGVSQASNDIIYPDLSEAVRGQLLDLVFRDLPIDILRLWTGPEQWTSQEMVARFRQSYLDNGMLAGILRRASPTLLLAPGLGKLKALPAATDYAEALADAIATLRSDHGVGIAVTGLANEPQHWSSDRIVATTLALRDSLDRRGLSQVGIVAPELPNVDTKMTIPALEALRANARAWTAIRGVGVHSYNMALTDAAQNLSRGKELWVTESGWGLGGRERPPRGEFDANDAAIISARFLADLNHGATHWIYFLGMRGETDQAFASKRTPELVVASKSGQIEIEPRYHYLAALARLFPKGTVMHPVTSSTHGRMSWTYGAKPSAIAAFGIGADGRKRAAIVNVTGSPSQRRAMFAPQSTIDVNLTLPGGAARYTVASHRAYRPIERSQAASDGRGELDLALSPFELKVLTEI